MCNGWAARYLSPNGSQVVSMSGDGGFSMPVGDFLPLLQYGLPVKVLLFANSCAVVAELGTPVSGLPSCGTMYKNPDLAAIARAACAYGIRVEKYKQLTGALKDVFRHPGPAPVDGVTDPDALSFPPRTGAEAVTGYARSTGRIVLDGGMGRVIRMARSSLRDAPRP